MSGGVWYIAGPAGILSMHFSGDHRNDEGPEQQPVIMLRIDSGPEQQLGQGGGSAQMVLSDAMLKALAEWLISLSLRSPFAASRELSDGVLRDLEAIGAIEPRDYTKPADRRALLADVFQTVSDSYRTEETDDE